MAKVEKSKLNWYSYVEQLDKSAELNPLAVMFRKLCLEMGIKSTVQFEDLLQNYVEKTIPQLNKQNATKGNIRSAMLNPNMTISTFMECVSILDLDSMEFTLVANKGGKSMEVRDYREYRRARTKEDVKVKRIKRK